MEIFGSTVIGPAIAGTLALSTFFWAYAQSDLAAAEKKRAYDVLALRKLELQKNAVEAEAWDKLSTRAILKRADKDLKTYFLKEQEYALIVRDYQAIKQETSSKNTVGMTQVLNRLRGSPFFDNNYRPEYDALWAILTNPDKPANDQVKESSITCSRLFSVFPGFEKEFKNTFANCKDGEKKGVVDLPTAMSALEVKLRN